MAAMMVVWTAEFAQSYIAHARRSRRPRPRRSIRPGMRSAERGNHHGRRQDPGEVDVPDDMLLRQPDGEALPAAATGEPGRPDHGLRRREFRLAAGLERGPPRDAVSRDGSVGRAPPPAHDQPGKVA